MAGEDETSLMGDGLGFEILAASLRADAGDTVAFMEALATKLGGALPHRVRIERSGGLFSHGHPVRHIAVNLGDWEFAIAADPSGALSASRTHTVRGIALKSESAPLDQWIEDLSASLADLARASLQDRIALQRLLA
ncbi:MAG TPA: hypothetical protein VF808_18285 [Ktedonobacterales bacterium]